MEFDVMIEIPPGRARDISSTHAPSGSTWTPCPANSTRPAGRSGCWTGGAGSSTCTARTATIRSTAPAMTGSGMSK